MQIVYQLHLHVFVYKLATLYILVKNNNRPDSVLVVISFTSYDTTSSSSTNLPVPGLVAATRKYVTLKRMRGSRSVMGTPVSMLSCVRVPLPVMISPMIMNAIPSWARRPTNNSFAFVKPNVGPATAWSYM